MTQRLVLRRSSKVVHSLREWTEAGLRIVQAPRQPTRQAISLASRGARDPHCGYTLTELLVVMIILTILVAATLPVARRVMDDSRTREASRQLNSMLTLARTRAAQTGRPTGVLAVCEAPIGGPASVRQATKLFLAQVPAPYAGDVLFTTVTPTVDLTSNPIGPWPLSLGSDPNSASVLSLVGNNETFRIQFDYKGTWYVGFRDGANNFYIAGPPGPDREWGRAGIDDDGNGSPNDQSEYLAKDSDDIQLSVVPPSRPVSYQLLRAPRPIGNPLELAGGTCIDLAYSGSATNGTDLAGPYNSVAVMFAPSGSIECIYRDQTNSAPQGTLHFLVGKVEKVGNPLGTNANHPSGLNMFDPATSNLADPNALWVSIGRQNGTVTTSENVTDTDHGSHSDPSWADPSPWGNDGKRAFLTEARSAATGREQMGGQ